MSTMPIWNGTNDERDRLMAAIAANCLCQTDGSGVVTNKCEPHKLLLDQQALDRLLYGRRIVHILKVEEMVGRHEVPG